MPDVTSPSKPGLSVFKRAATAFTCSSCGKDYSAHKRPQPGKRNYCPECRAAGEPQADKARDYRARKREKEDANQ